MAPAHASDPMPRWLAWVAVAAVFAYAAIVRYRFLASSPLPVGVDGYFYPVQLRALLDTGQLRFPAPPLTLWLMAPLAAIWGPIAGAKIGAAVGTAAACLPAYALGARVGRLRAAGLLAAVLVATSPSSFFLAAEFVKNGIAIAVAGGAVVAAMAAIDRPSRRRIAVAAAALIAAWLAHKLAFAVAVALIAPPVAVAVGRRRRWIALAALAAAAVATLALGALFPDQLPSVRDLALIGDVFGSEPHWSLPMLEIDEHRLGFRGEIAIAAVVAFALIAAVAINRRTGAPPSDATAPDRALSLAAAGMCLFLAIPWLEVANPQAVGLRLRLIGFLPLAIVAAALAGQIARRMSTPIAAALIAGFAVGLCLYRPLVYDLAVVRANPAIADAAAALRGTIPRGDTVVVPDRQIMFMVAWYSDARVTLRPEAVPPERRWRLYPGGMMDAELRAALREARTTTDVPAPVSLIPGAIDGLVLMREVTWNWILAKLPEAARRVYQEWQTT